MEIFYYYNFNLEIAPVKQFLLKYNLDINDSEKTKNHKIKVLAFIDQTIQIIAEHKGKPIPPIAKTIRGYKFHEMRIKDGSNLIRILYFGYMRDKLILLNAFEKPEKYDKKLKKQIESKIANILNQTKIYYENFINNNKNYEKYK